MSAHPKLRVRCIKVLAIFLWFMVATAHGPAQGVGNTYVMDFYGEVEQSTYILSSSDSTEIDAYTETENFDFSGEDVEYIGAEGGLFDGGNLVYYDGYDDYYDAFIPATASTHVGDQYTMYGESYACYYSGGEGYDCDYEDLGGFGVSINTAVPQLNSFSPSSGNQNTSSTFTATGQNLIDDFGLAGVTVYGYGVNARVDPSGASKNQLTIDYSIAADATIGDHNVTISTSFGESDVKKFTVGYPPAVVLNVDPPIWPAGSQNLPVTIRGTGFGSAPTLSISALGVQNTPPSTNGSGSQITTTVTVAENAPNEPVAILVTPGYAGQTYTCGSCNGGSPVGSNTAMVQAAVPPAPTIQRDMSTDPNNPNFQTITGNVNVLIGERISLKVVPAQGFTLASQSWAFSRANGGTGGITDITGGFTGQTGPNPSSINGGVEASDPDVTQPSILYYFVNPGTTETVTVTVTYTLADGSASLPATATIQFTIGGPQNVKVNIGDGGNGQLGTIAVLPLAGNIGTYPGLALGIPPQAVGMQAASLSDLGIYLEDSANLPANKGWFIWVQLLVKDHYRFLLPVNQNTVQASCYPKGWSNRAQLDATYPYGSGPAGTGSAGDPGRSMNDEPNDPIYGDSSITFSAKTFLLWDPAIGSAGCKPAQTATALNNTLVETASSCLSTPVPLGYVAWTWAGEGIDLLKNADNGSTGHLQAGSTKTIKPFAPDSTYPEWTSAVKTHSTVHEAFDCTQVN